MATIKLNDLKKTGKELNALLFSDNEPQIDIKSPAETLKSQILEANELVEEDELKELSQLSKDVIAELIAELNTTPPEAEKSAQDEDDDEDEFDKISDAGHPEYLDTVMISDDITELKTIIKTVPVFQELRKTIGIEKNIERLRGKMQDILGVQTKTIKGAVKPATDIKKPAVKKEAKKESAPAYNRVDAVCEALKTSPKTWNDWADEANELMEANGGSANINENKFIIRYIAKMAPHFDFGFVIPTK